MAAVDIKQKIGAVAGHVLRVARGLVNLARDRAAAAFGAGTGVKLLWRRMAAKAVRKLSTRSPAKAGGSTW